MLCETKRKLQRGAKILEIREETVLKKFYKPKLVKIILQNKNFIFCFDYNT